MGATLTTYGDVMRTKYLKAMQSAVFVGTPALDFFEKRMPGEGDPNRGIMGGLQLGQVPLADGTGWGTGVQVEFHIGKNQGTGPRAREQSATVGYLPTPGKQSFKNGLLTPKSYFGRGRVSGAVIDATTGNGLAAVRGGASNQQITAAGINALDREMRMLPGQMRRDLNIDLFGSGKGILATVTSTTNLVTIQLDNTRNLKANDEIVVADTVGGTAAVARTIVSVDSDTQITVDSQTSVTASKSIFRSGIHNTNYASAYGVSLSGLGLIVSASGAYAGIDRSLPAYAALRSYVPSAYALSTLDIVGAFEEAAWQIYQRNGELSVIFCDQNIWKKFGAAYFGLQVWQTQIKILKGRYPALMFGDVPLVRDPAVAPWTAWCLDASKFWLGIEKDLSLMNRDGQELVRGWSGDGSTDTDDYTFGYKHSVELGCENPACQAKVTVNSAA